MDPSRIGWELWRSFVAVAATGSLSAAARRLTLTQPTVGRHIDALESALGAPLFTRSQNGLKPTTLAVALVPHAEAMEAASASLSRAAAGEVTAETGTVRLAASEIVGTLVLPPMLARFSARFPGMAVELAVSNRNEDLIRRDADLAIRMVRPTQSGLLARRLGTVGLGLYASLAYAERRGLPRHSAELDGHALVGPDREVAALQALRAAGFGIGRERFTLRSDSDVAQLAAVRAGAGIGICQHGLAAGYPELVPVLAEGFQLSLDMWLAMHEDLRQAHRVRVLFDHLADELSAYLRTAGRLPAARVTPAQA